MPFKIAWNDWLWLTNCRQEILSESKHFWTHSIINQCVQKSINSINESKQLPLLMSHDEQSNNLSSQPSLSLSTALYFVIVSGQVSSSSLVSSGIIFSGHLLFSYFFSWQVSSWLVSYLFSCSSSWSSLFSEVHDVVCQVCWVSFFQFPWRERIVLEVQLGSLWIP